MKKVTILILILVLACSLLVGCGSSEKENKDGKSVKLTFMTNVVGEKATALENAVKEFEAETGYEVEFSAPGASYEELMKTKMSSNQLPDVFTTHGWSVARYSEYLMPVNEMEFAGRISEQIKPVITNKEGKMFVLPIDIDIAGIVYNKAVLDAAGVNPDDIKTWADFTEACDKISKTGVTPLHIGGKDSWTIGQFFDWAAPSFYITDEANSKAEELKAGTFDEKAWEAVAGLMASWTEKGYFNKDVLTADYQSDVDSLATGKAAFGFYGNYAIADATKVNESVEMGMMPVPSNSESDEPSLIAGEDIACGIWKDTKYSKEAQELLNYLAKPEVCAKIAQAAGNVAGLTDAKVDLGAIQQYLDKYSTVETFPYFDREYLPSGMWDVMCTTGADILAQKNGAVADAAKVMKQSFADKFNG